MIKKQNIWALTLFSLILILSVYYITLPEELDISSVSNEVKTTIKEENNSEVIATLKAENNDEKEKKTKELQEILTKEDSTNEEKNSAYEELKLLNLIKTKEEEISLKISDKYKVENFVQIKDAVQKHREHSRQCLQKSHPAFLLDTERIQRRP